MVTPFIPSSRTAICIMLPRALEAVGFRRRTKSTARRRAFVQPSPTDLSRQFSCLYDEFQPTDRFVNISTRSENYCAILSVPVEVLQLIFELVLGDSKRNDAMWNGQNTDIAVSLTRMRRPFILVAVCRS